MAREQELQEQVFQLTARLEREINEHAATRAELNKLKPAPPVLGSAVELGQADHKTAEPVATLLALGITAAEIVAHSAAELAGTDDAPPTEPPPPEGHEPETQPPTE
jgi:hypothetical protein